MTKALLSCMLMVSFYASAQLGFSHELGVIAGPVPFQSDYGLRYDFETNKGNLGFGGGIVHYLNFSYQSDCDCYTTYTFFNDHFKIRNELSYMTIDLNHFGELAEKNSPGGEFLRSVSGRTKLLNIGAQLEFFPLSIRDFENGGFAISPFGSIGVMYTNYTPEANGYEEARAILAAADPDNNLLAKYGPDAINVESGGVFSLTGSVGARYKFSAISDVLLEARWQYFLSNDIDGLNPNPDLYPENRANDWLFFLTIGYIFYL
ncbi:glutamate dehydrogenase [Sungkyunkwania multivorans]|uniref:Glutamate dehydrogenase n=1 Tax=Sungkyunkwania multivorans TaxID=1173618 RepID=A0ABW3D3S5_9FLAO